MQKSPDELSNVVRMALQPVLRDAKIDSIVVEEDIEDGSLRIIVEVSKAKSRLPKDILLQIVNAASDAVADSGEERFPKVFGRFAATQEFAA